MSAPAFLTLAALAGLTVACHRKQPPPIDTSKFELPAVEAVVRRVFADAEPAGEAKVGIIVFSERMKDSSQEFRGRLSDLGLPLVSSSRMTQVWVGPVARVVDRETNFQPLQLQITSVEPREDSVREIVAAWAFGDKMERRRYLARPSTDGKWTVEPLEVIASKP
ncbi:MAG: hypothetical protein ACR2OZ_01350 [Verrucomicrobiales bacterium]